MDISWRATKPADDEFAPFYAGYVKRAPDGDVVETMDLQLDETLTLLRSLPESMGDHTYAPGKWSIREIIGHLSDAERVFSYRALRFSRGDTAPVEGFDEDMYVANAAFGRRTLDDLLGEFEHLRRSSIHLFGGLTRGAFSMRGTASGKEITVRALAFVLPGHEAHHLDVLRTRYL
ncbi:MAG: DinB family protein [Gemmatimonadaceae bacterium]